MCGQTVHFQKFATMANGRGSIWFLSGFFGIYFSLTIQTSTKNNADMTKVAYRTTFTVSLSFGCRLISHPPGSYDCDGVDVAFVTFVNILVSVD